jgi:hypothetical protein
MLLDVTLPLFVRQGVIPRCTKLTHLIITVRLLNFAMARHDHGSRRDAGFGNRRTRQDHKVGSGTGRGREGQRIASAGKVRRGMRWYSGRSGKVLARGIESGQTSLSDIDNERLVRFGHVKRPPCLCSVT